MAAAPLRGSSTEPSSAVTAACGVNESSDAAGASRQRNRSAPVSRIAAHPASPPAATHEICFMPLVRISSPRDATGAWRDNAPPAITGP